MKISFVSAAYICIVINAASVGIASAAGSQSMQPVPVDPRTQAANHLKFLYTMYLAIRGCTEASQEQSEPRFKPTVSLSEAQKVLRAADASARSVGIDVDRAWFDTSSIGQAVGEALKQATEENFRKCQQSGMMFRTTTSQLQMAIARLKGTIPLIEKDF